MSEMYEIQMPDYITLVENSPKEAQERARAEFERRWAVHVGFDLPLKVGDAWWPLTAPSNTRAMQRWVDEGVKNGWMTLS